MSLMEKIDYLADMFVSEPIDEGQGLNLLFRGAFFFMQWSIWGFRFYNIL